MGEASHKVKVFEKAPLTSTRMSLALTEAVKLVLVDLGIIICWA